MTKLSLIETESNVSTKLVLRLETLSKNICPSCVPPYPSCTWLCGFALVGRTGLLFLFYQ